MREILARCDELRVITDGYFDMRAAGGDRIDPSDLVKGWSVDRAAELIDERGWRNYAISAGGDIRRWAGADPRGPLGSNGYEAMTLLADGRALRTARFPIADAEP